MEKLNYSLLTAEDFIMQKENKIDLQVPAEEFQKGKSEFDQLKEEVVRLNFKKKILFSLKHVWKYPFNCMKVGIAWNYDQSLILIESQAFSNFIGIKQNSLNKNLTMYGINLVSSPSCAKCVSCKKWKYRKSMLFTLNGFTTENEIHTLRPLSLEKINEFKNQAEMKYEDMMKDVYNEYVESNLSQTNKIIEVPIKKSSRKHSVDTRSENTSPNLSYNTSPAVIKKNSPKIFPQVIMKTNPKTNDNILNITVLDSIPDNQNVDSLGLDYDLFPIDEDMTDIMPYKPTPIDDLFNEQLNYNNLNSDENFQDQVKDKPEETNQEQNHTSSMEDWCDLLNSLKRGTIKEIYLKEVQKLNLNKREEIKKIINAVIDKEKENDPSLQDNDTERIINMYGSPREFVSFLDDLFDEKGRMYDWVNTSIVLGYDWHLSIENLKEPILFIGDQQYRIIKWGNGKIATIANGEFVIKNNLPNLLFDYFKLEKKPRKIIDDFYYPSYNQNSHWITFI